MALRTWRARRSIRRFWSSCGRRSNRSVLEMPAAGEDHRDAVLVGGGGDLFILDAAAGLNNGGDARGSGAVDRVGEREKGVGRQDRALRAVAGFLDGDLDRIDAAHLARAAADERLV